MLITNEWLNRHKTARGAWTRKQLAAVGVDWPPAEGWKQRIIGSDVSPENAATFEAGGAAHEVDPPAAPTAMLNIYTDGSCEPNPGPGGWAFVVYDTSGAEVHNASGWADHTTNNRMEMEAVLRALEWAAWRGAAMIHSDSQYVVKGITSWSAGWKARGWKRKERNGSLSEVKNVDLWQAIDAARGPGHGFVWVRGHIGIVGNERADRLAEAARCAATPTPA